MALARSLNPGITTSVSTFFSALPPVTNCSCDARSVFALALTPPVTSWLKWLNSRMQSASSREVRFTEEDNVGKCSLTVSSVRSTVCAVRRSLCKQVWRSLRAMGWVKRGAIRVWVALHGWCK